MRFTADEENYIRKHYSHMSPTRIAEKLGRSKRSIYDKADNMGLRHGVPRDHVAVRGAVGDVGAARNIIRVARREGVLRQSRVGHRLYSVPAKWLDDYLGKRIDHAKNEDVAEREGWYSARDIAAALGMAVNVVSVSLGTGKGPLGRAMSGVTRIQGYYGRYYYEPEATRMALHSLGVTHRRAA